MCVEWGWHIYNIVESESDPLTRRAIDLFKKEPLKGNSEVHLHTPTKFGEDRSKDLGGDREQTDRQTDKRCSIYSMMQLWITMWNFTVEQKNSRQKKKGNIEHNVLQIKADVYICLITLIVYNSNRLIRSIIF